MMPGETPPAASGTAADLSRCQGCASLQQGDFSSCENVEEERPVGANYSADHVVNEDKVPGVLMQGHHDGGSTGFFDQDHFFDEDLQAAIDFFKLPPPLLSPVPSPPLACSPHLGSLPSVLTPGRGPLRPPLLAPLIATPPRTSQPLSPLVSSASPSSPASPGQTSPLGEISAPPVVPPRPRNPRRASPPHPSPSPSSASASERIVSSPLQFCAATPKHALPVPGRLPPCASGHSAVGGPQENSVKILDTMYPELSARARTLSLLKGNLQLTRGAPTDCTNVPGPVSTIIGFKAITSTSTAFVKTGGSSGGDCNQDKSRDVGTQDSSGKRTLAACTLRSAKRLRLDSGSPEPETRETTAGETHENLQRSLLQAEVAPADKDRSCSSPAASTVSQLPLNPKETEESEDEAIASALKKIAESSFDLLPVIRSHVYVGNISKKPVMRDQEKEVVFEFSTTKKNAPVDVGFMVSKLLLTIQLCPKTEFQSSEKFGEDLSDNTWEYIFAIDLLCCHQKWIWTHDNIISKELWPVMDKWIKYRKGHANIAYTPDIIIASILRLIGRLGQLGLKEGFPSAVKNISSVIGMFIQHAQDEERPVQTVVDIGVAARECVETVTDGFVPLLAPLGRLSAVASN
ncbi:hypothetical protein TREES_T100015476 [Tupaia chinensis]|uniref:Little elongation complex subunit 1 C-terminal domain-containing protein n=1 Tax=Tupaia chinensis TaxID=246437 RepID=L8Y687_TUPCH|nr:hypothetical protein TREES_T100015476 [Tupaia chinensis]